MMTEAEEFEFRLRLEQEQAAETPQTPAGPRSTSLEGVGSEMGKAAVRGAVGAGDTAAMIENVLPATRLARRAAETFAPDITRRVGESIKAFRDRLLAQNQADPNASTAERMLGTGTELATQGLLTGGAGGGVGPTLTNVLAPAVGGAIGEQVGGETGKLIGSLAAPFATSRVGAALNPRVSDDMKMLVEHGAEPTLGQVAGGALKKAETFPGASLFTEGARATAAQSLTTAAANRALVPLGLGPKALGKVNLKEMSGNDIYAKAEDIASKAYSDILPQLNISLSGNAGVAFSKAASDLKAVMEPAGVKELDKVLGLLQKGKGNVNITGEDMKLVDKGLGQLRRQYMGDPAVNSQQIAQKVTEFQGALRDMVATQNPQFALPLQRANAAWNNLVRVEVAVSKAAGNDGFFTPQQLQAAIKQLETYRPSFSRGEGVMQDFGSAAVREMNPRGQANVPYSMLNQGLRAGAAGVGLGAAGAGAGAAAGIGAGTGAAIPLIGAAGLYGAAYTPFGQRFARAALTGERPQFLGTLGDILRETRTNPAFATGLPQLQGLPE